MSTLPLQKKHIFFLFALCFFFFPVSSFAFETVYFNIVDTTSSGSAFSIEGLPNTMTSCYYEGASGIYPDMTAQGTQGVCTYDTFTSDSASMSVMFQSILPQEYWLKITADGVEYVATSTWTGTNWVYQEYTQNSTSTVFPTFNFVEGIQSIENTRFLTADITSRAINPKDVLINISYFLDPLEVQRNVSSRNPTLVTVKWANRNSLDFSSLGFAIATSTGTGTVLATIPDGSISDSGTFDLLIQFSNGGCSIGLSECPFPDSYIYTEFTLSGKVVMSTGLLENYNYLPTASSSNQYLDCGILELGGCLVNVAIFLFTPSEVSLNNLQEYKNTLPTKEPFAYFFAYKNLVASQSVSSASQSLSIDMTPANLGTIVILSEQNTNAILGSQTLVTLRTVMSGLIWFLTFIFIILTSVYALNKFRV